MTNLDPLLPNRVPRLDQLQGGWNRSLIVWPNGVRDVTTRVMWLQGPTCYIDLRQPAASMSFAGVGSLRDLDLAQVEALAAQEGFAGVLLQHHDCFEWSRLIDFQPRPIYLDRGTPADHGDVMIEKGCDVAYIEHWHRERGAEEPVASLKLRDRESGCLGMVVRVGKSFMFARSRTTSLDETRHLIDYVRDAPTLLAAQDLVDCELSLGVIGGAWTIKRSTLPYRVDANLSPRRAGSLFFTSDMMPDGALFKRTWTILSDEGIFVDPSANTVLVACRSR